MDLNARLDPQFLLEDADSEVWNGSCVKVGQESEDSFAGVLRCDDPVSTRLAPQRRAGRLLRPAASSCHKYFENVPRKPTGK